MTSLAHHNDVGAYAIGALDPTDAARFEEHLATCQQCALELDELLGLGPLLAEYAQDARAYETVPPRPSGALLDGLLTRAAVERGRHRKRRLALVAAAAALVLAASFGGAALLAGEDATSPPDLVQAAYEAGEKFHGSEPGGGPGGDVDATVSLTGKRWGTEVAVRLAGVSGPRTCGLVAVGRDGTEQTVTTWAVPDEGYGAGKAVYYLGGAAYDPADIDHFEVRTLDGERLVTVDK